MEVAIGTHGEEVGPAVFFHLEHVRLDDSELAGDELVGGGEVGESCDDGGCFVLGAGEDEPLA